MYSNCKIWCADKYAIYRHRGDKSLTKFKNQGNYSGIRLAWRKSVLIP